MCATIAKHRRPNRLARRTAMATCVGTAATMLVFGAGAAWADPVQPGVSGGDGQQGGVTPAPNTSQGGITPAPAAPAVPDPNSGPGFVPDPPYDGPYRQAPTYPSGPTSGPSVAPVFHPTAPLQVAPVVRPIAAEKGWLRIGDWSGKQPAWMADDQAASINRWSAWGEAQISRGWRSVGLPDREADRRAAATILGVAIGGASGATLLGVPAAIVGGLGGAALGAGIGALVGGPAVGPSTAIGAGIGAAAGAAALGVPFAFAGAVGGGLLGGVIGNIYGAGDSNADPALPPMPWLGAPAPQQQLPATPPAPSGPIVYQAVVPPETAARAGLPAVNYNVQVNGDTQISVGDRSVGWSGAQAEAPLKALGPLEQPARKIAQDATNQITAALNSIPGVHAGPPAAPAHGRH